MSQCILNQQEIAKASGLSQSYIHYVLKGDRTPSLNTAEHLEEATGICREAWLWPDRHHNPYMPFVSGLNCLACANRPTKSAFVSRRMIHLLEKVPQGNRMLEFDGILKQCHKHMGFPDTVVFGLWLIREHHFLLFATAGDGLQSAPRSVSDEQIPHTAKQVREGLTVEFDSYLHEELGSDADSEWFRHRKAGSFFLVPTEKLVMETTTISGSSIYKWSGETIRAIRSATYKLEKLFGNELDQPDRYFAAV